MRARFLNTYGRHRPRCKGWCLAPEVDSEHNAVPASVLLIVIPTGLFVLLVPFPTYWILESIAIALLVLSLVYLILAMYTEPGILPTEAISERRPEDARRPRVTHVVVEGKRHELGAFRAKMCRQTENCVEEFDHYCPWVGNAVGRRNYRYFIAFVTTVSFLALVVGASSCIHLSAVKFGSGQSEADEREPVLGSSWGEVILMVLVAYTIIVLCSVCGLVCFHLRLIAINQTTNENIRGIYFSHKNPHDLGACRNCINFALRPVPRSRVISFIGGSGDAVTRVPTTDEGIEMI
ncbi:hypothetical protein CTAYLR_009784 [Chrysophaeum taylorii]|uniref:Palmitoyltransferase n=1 Tax=Chrysophaeum taylorii TaxID=2483200 RepID=A0AAD7UFJ7_9STRA|nr:hypothetical protein CTAYLR_009784 [Chrysophaeum taylorii]